MRHRLSHRILSALCGLWLAFALGEPAALHACAMHGAHGLRHAHGSHHSAHPGSDRSDSQHGKDRASLCTCLGGCCVAVHVTAPDAPSLVDVDAVNLPSRVAAPPALVHRPTAIAYARPPTIGPPPHTA